MSTKTTLKRIALVAVSALGLSFATVTPSGAIPPWAGTGGGTTVYSATYSAPSSLTLLEGYSTATVGSIALTVNAPSGVVATGNNTTGMTLTVSKFTNGDAEDTALFNNLSISEVVGSDDLANANTNGTVVVGTKGANSWDIDMSPTSAGFTTASAKVTMKINAGLTAAANGGKLKYSISYVNDAGVKGTLDGTFTLTIGAVSVAGTPTISPSSLAANILAGGTATATVTTPYSIKAGQTVTGPTFTLGGSVVNSSFNVTATATGGLVTVARTGANTFASSLLKDSNTGAYSATFTITVSAPATAVNAETITVSTPAGTYTATVFGGQTWDGTVTLTRANSLSGAAYGWVGGDKSIYAPATASGVDAGTVTVYTNIPASSPNLYPAWTFAMTGVGSFSIPGVATRAAYAVVPAALAGTAPVSFYGDGRPGKGTLTVTANGTVVATQVVNFYGPAASIEVTPIYTIAKAGNGLTGYESGSNVATADIATDGSLDYAGCTPSYAPAVCAGEDNDPSLAVRVLDALGTPLPVGIGAAGSVVITSSNTAVVPSGAADKFLDSGFGPYAVGALYNHVTFATAPTAKSGDSATLTFTYINSLGATITATQKVTVGGSTAGGTVTMTTDKDVYAPGERIKLTITAKDASGNPVYDNLKVGSISSNKLAIGKAGGVYSGGSFVWGDDAGEDLFAPGFTGDFNIILYTGTAAGASITLTKKVSADASTEAANAAKAAAEAATDAAAEAIDAANAATDAANLAAEAADAATVAAEEARDAADAATAAVEALATQVAALMAALKAQITTLANTIAKIAKKVKA